MDKVFQCVEPDEGEDGAARQMNTFMKMSKFNVDGEIQKTEKQVFSDHREQLKLLKKKLNYIEGVRDKAIRHYGSVEHYRKNPHGRALERNLASSTPTNAQLLLD